ncbi:metallophosphoesterase [Bradyrhizobium sp. WSM 1738]|uniref:metallophosphoesterase family protein n=1 Tax=Bradyrhizobium hereditatis TaxID=2821405 RepID=UPI001CE34972|nr:metallophosphoesterase [Bradyrhizobium hereditatis]MCA6115191.1 metallophosphoesterase [Bradyrhizobium hereditatis]
MGDIRTFRDHFLSLYQSAAADYVSQKRKETTTEGAVEAADPLMEAVNEIAELRSKNASEIPDTEEGIADIPRICASLGLRYLEALVSGDHARAARIQEQMTGGTCDLKWASTLSEYAKFFGANGSRGKIPYVRAAEVGAHTIPIAAGARIAVFGDWGTGAQPARRILTRIREQKPDVLLHLGDIDYSGTPAECQTNFVNVIRSTFDPAIPTFTLAGNHDMYSGGLGYYDLARTLNAGEQAQKASFFCLRSADAAWQILAMDTGLHDYSPISVTDALTFVEEDEQQWLEQRVAEFPGETILVSHHQLFSAFSQIGKPRGDGTLLPYNPNLLALFERLKAKGKIAAWLWGHEHNLCVYQGYLGLERGRCIGHGAIPIFEEEKPYDVLKGIADPPGLVAGTQLNVSDGAYEHGFAMVALGTGGGKTKVEYFTESGLKYAEEL